MSPLLTVAMVRVDCACRAAIGQAAAMAAANAMAIRRMAMDFLPFDLGTAATARPA
jgi:hypothetical protein